MFISTGWSPWWTSSSTTACIWWTQFEKRWFIFMSSLDFPMTRFLKFASNFGTRSLKKWSKLKRHNPKTPHKRSLCWTSETIPVRKSVKQFTPIFWFNCVRPWFAKWHVLTRFWLLPTSKVMQRGFNSRTPNISTCSRPWKSWWSTFRSWIGKTPSTLSRNAWEQSWMIRTFPLII